MFCNKKCQKCNHYITLFVEKDGKPDSIQKCAFHAILDSLIRNEQGNVRLQASIESSRNQKNVDDLNIKDTIAKGFLGLIHSVNEQPKAIDHIQDLVNVIEYKIDSEEVDG